MSSSLLDGLVAYWPLNEQVASGDRADVHGILTATDVNTVPGVAGMLDGAADLEAGNNERFSVASNAGFDTGDAVNWTFAAWVNLESKGAARCIAARDNSFNLQFNNGANRFRLTNRDSANNIVATLDADALGIPALATWYDVIIWNDAASNLIGIRVNDTHENTIANGTTGASGSGNAFMIGAAGDGSVQWDGMIHGVGFWNRLLTAAEKTARYNGGSGLPYPFYRQNPVMRGLLRGTLAGI